MGNINSSISSLVYRGYGQSISGWAYNAALHCCSCTEEHFEGRSFVDCKGNEPSPVFKWDEPGDSGDYCDDCGEALDNMPADFKPIECITPKVSKPLLRLIDGGRK